MAGVQQLQVPCCLVGGVSQAAINTRKGLAARAGYLTLPLFIMTHCPRNVPKVCPFRGFELGNQIWAGHAWFHWSDHAMPSFYFLPLG